MTTTIGSLDLNAFSDLYNDSTQYFWFESNSSATYGAGVHITLSPDTSFIANPTGQNILMNTDGFSIRNGLLPMMTLDNDSLDFNTVDTTAGTYITTAMFGVSGSQIGLSGESHLEIDYRSIKLIDKQNATYFYVGDLRDKSTGTYQATESLIATENQTEFWVDLNIDQIITVKVDNVVLASTEYTYTSGRLRFNLITPPQEGATVEVTYTTNSPLAKVYTLGTRDSSKQVGACSFVEGYDNVASQSCSHAEGRNNTASGAQAHAEGRSVIASGYSSHAEGSGTTASSNSSHAEGYQTTASGASCHAEGWGTTASGITAHAEGWLTTASSDSSHAEGYQTTASGLCSHAEGYQTQAKGSYSHASGRGTIAQSGQTAIGKYNIESSNYSLIIGNGSDDNNRSNALTVDWVGEVQLYMDVDSAASETTAATSGTDMDLFNAIRDLGWYSSVIS